ncbi:GntR family transcriptional regulator [Enterococcus sp. BWB1-3]|uniref:GntR family transcriptional regulator n=1 Tax=unclassified Enterococcus TaxID=2608891 RepID=UPI0019215275|nr:MULTISPECIES: GntR family transcriptional regulator [unclassified Enterococcus]MBL1228864.1 GntR family transcriptional regulator [Enterococcus sp. BWB1-3]MCB5951593.1 GntR family transcriptional regulator [Enterococcus sp. BWT-B8]MCB5954685.1 GntR family transcriptional regulator [Enterococcus sp. CWB-B31]
MLMEIDMKSAIPIYQQIRNQIILGIASGKLGANESLPSVRQMADEIGINMMTVSKAYNTLKLEGYIITDRRNGTKVAEFPPATEEFIEEFNQALELTLAKAAIHQLNDEDIHAIVTQILQNFK